MPSVWIIMSIGIIIISFIVGGAFYYFISIVPNPVKKKQLEQVFSLLVNLVIYIWIGKILVNFSIFVKDPLAVLAYPSNSSAFYIAIILLTINVLYKVWKEEEFDVNQWFTAFVPIVLATSFTYEFIQYIQKQSLDRLSHLILLMAILIVFILFQERLEANILAFLQLIMWTGGLFGLSFISSYVSIFGYTIHPWFSLLLFLVFLGLGYYNHRKQVS